MFELRWRNPLRVRCGLRHLFPDRYADDEEDQAYDEEEEKQKLSDAGCSRRNSRKSEQCRDQCDD